MNFSNKIKSLFAVALLLISVTSEAQRRSVRRTRAYTGPRGNTVVVQNNVRVNTNRYPNPHYRYYYGGGYNRYPAYYRPYTRPTFGISINVLPRGYSSFSAGPSRYFYHGGNYYQRRNNTYITVAPVYGAVVPALPGGAILVPIGGRNYYEYMGTYYSPRVSNGGTVYEVAGTGGYLQSDRYDDSNDLISDASLPENMNAPKTELPGSYETVSIGDRIYYKSPTGEYYVKLIDEGGKVTYQQTSITGN